MDGVNCNMADSFTFLSFFLPLSLFLLSHLALPFPVQEPQPFCPPFEYCGDLFDIQPPFTAIHKPKCGLYAVNCDDKMKPTIKFEDEGKSYVVKKILYEQSTLVIQDEDISNHSPSDFCNFLYNFTVPPSLLHFHLKSPNHTFVNCNRGHQPLFNDSYMGVYNYTDCEDRIIYYWPEDLPLLHYLSPLQLHHCSVTHFPLSLDLVDPDVPNDLFRLLDFGFGLQWNRTQENGKKPTIKFEGEGRSYAVKEILYEESTLVIQDEEISNHSPSDFCNFLYNFTMPPSPIHPLFLNAPNYTFVNCKGDHQPLFNDSYKGVYNYTGCEDRIIYYWPEDLQLLHDLLPFQLLNCSVTHFPLSLYDLVDPDVPNKLFSLLKFGFGLLWNRTQKCKECQEVKKGFCGGNHLSGDFNCFPMPRVLQTLSNQPGLDNPTERNEGHSGEKSSKKKRSINWKILIGVGTVIGGFLLTSLILILYFRYCKKRYPSLSFNVLSRAISSFPNCNSEIGSGIQTQFFSYKELEEATNNFDPSKELGDGGFGTVYHGKLWDGRFVAIKRLYQNNHRRVEQFKNEVNILSRLRHQNLVTLYGCSSRHSRVLLLVYEFIPNGTVAYHLHGDGAKTNKLTWSTRMCIAIETADALAYLHNVEIIHRDVKTDNILLDNNFCVKVADFGLSRLFPLDVTHVSTVPQGTPGYVDPDYHRCYQLTDRSDVYSFGVVLIELVSSLPAVDISRHRHEINLANMAINKIQNDALHELVDPRLGFDSDISVRRMITSVAELAFRCLQDEKEVRPSMEEVLEELRGISGEKYNAVKTEEAGTPMDDIC